MKETEVASFIISVCRPGKKAEVSVRLRDGHTRWGQAAQGDDDGWAHVGGPPPAARRHPFPGRHDEHPSSFETEERHSVLE